MFCFWGFWFCINCLSFNWCLIVYWLRATDLNFVHKFSQNCCCYCCCCCLMTPELKNPALKSHQSLLSLPFWSYFVLFLFRMIFFFLIRAVDFFRERHWFCLTKTFDFIKIQCATEIQATNSIWIVVYFLPWCILFTHFDLI